MRYAVVVLLAAGLGACSQADQDRAREQAHQTREDARQSAEKLRQDSREALHDAKAGAQRASRELNRDLNNARDKIRQAVDAPPRDDNSR